MSYLTKDDEKRFWNKVSIKNPDDCWEWKKGLSHGYGSFQLRGYNERAHRVAFIASGKMKNWNNCVLHKCDNPKCVNPDHLFEGTNGDNLIDMNIKGRSTNGKLNSEAVKVIKWMLKYKPKYGLATKLARLYKVNCSVISTIKHENTWKQVKIT